MNDDDAYITLIPMMLTVTVDDYHDECDYGDDDDER